MSMNLDHGFPARSVFYGVLIFQKLGMPEASVRNRMKMDGIDAKVVATFFGEKLSDEDDGGPKPMEPPCPKPDMAKYEKMKVLI